MRVSDIIRLAQDYMGLAIVYINNITLYNIYKISAL